MWVPVAKLRKEGIPETSAAYNNVYKYLMYNTETGLSELMSSHDLREKHEIGGFGFSSNTPRLNIYWTELGFIGEENKQEFEYYAVVRRLVQGNSQLYLVRHREGHILRLTPQQILELEKKGHKFAGIIIQDGLIKKSKDVPDSYVQPSLKDRIPREKVS